MEKRSFLKCIALFAMGLNMASAAAAEPPEGFVGINYFRADNDYAGWGLHAWSRIAGGSDVVINGVSWMAPLKPTGTNEDGSVYWHVELAEFGKSGKVFYIIHKRDTKEQGGKDQSFDGKQQRQIWVNQGDPAIYTSLEDAQKARKN